MPSGVNRAYPHVNFVAFRDPAPIKLEDSIGPDEAFPKRHIYSRYTNPVTTRVEKVLSSLMVSNTKINFQPKQVNLALMVLIGRMRHHLCLGVGCHLFGRRKHPRLELQSDHSAKALVHLNPKRLAIRGGYHGVHTSIGVYKKTKPELVVPILL